MQYALLIHSDPDVIAALPEDERATVNAEFAAAGADPRVVTTLRLQPRETATCVRVDGGRTLLTDGPFADTKEVFGGVYLVDADNLDEAIEVAAMLPATRLGGAVEIRPVAAH
jgi:hypothetical protein